MDMQHWDSARYHHTALPTPPINFSGPILENPQKLSTRTGQVFQNRLNLACRLWAFSVRQKEKKITLLTKERIFGFSDDDDDGGGGGFDLNLG